MAAPQAKFIGAAILFAAASMGQYQVYSFSAVGKMDEGEAEDTIPLNLRPSDWCTTPCDTCQGAWAEDGYIAKDELKDLCQTISATYYDYDDDPNGELSQAMKQPEKGSCYASKEKTVRARTAKYWYRCH